MSPRLLAEELARRKAQQALERKRARVCLGMADNMGLEVSCRWFELRAFGIEPGCRMASELWRVAVSGLEVFNSGLGLRP